MTEHTITLLDGRTLGYAIYGAENGRPVLYFHGTPSSRLEVLLLKEFGVDIEDWLKQNDVLLIAVDRPGMGLSDYHYRGTFLSVSEDVRQLLHHIQITTCSVLSWSGGGPFSLAMAYQNPTIIKGVFILCGFIRHFDAAVLKQMKMNKWYFRVAKRWPWLLRLALQIFCKKNNYKQVPQWLTDMPEVDYNLIKDARHFKAVTGLTIKEACKQSTYGAVREAALYFNNFGFDLSDIIQPVYYWWGTEDKSVIQLHPQTAEQLITDYTVYYKDGEGHLSLFINYFTEAVKLAVEL
jgi:pimeloyl-ACP methyl ester carboxylesterase